METGEIQKLVNDMLDLRLDLGRLRLEVANMGGRLLCHDDDCPHCPEIRDALRKAQPPTKDSLLPPRKPLSGGM